MENEMNIPGRYLYTVTYSDGMTETMDSQYMDLYSLMYELDKCSIEKITVELNPAWVNWSCTKH